MGGITEREEEKERGGSREVETRERRVE